MIDFLVSLIDPTNIDTMRKLTSGSFVVVDLVIVGTFLLYVATNYERTMSWKELQPVRGALALALYFAGRLISQAWAWVAIDFTANGLAIVKYPSTYWIAVVGALLSLWGTVCITIVLTPPRYRYWNWLFGLGAGFLYLLVTHYLTN